MDVSMKKKKMKQERLIRFVGGSKYNYSKTKKNFHSISRERAGERERREIMRILGN